MLRQLLRCVFGMLAAAGLGHGAAWAGNPFPPAPGHENLPVVFWSHYMPQVGTLQLAHNEHCHGGTDNYPFLSLDGSRVEVFARNIREALDAGINGFQMLTFIPPEMFAAARQVKEQTGQMFYLAPQWCGMGEDPKVAQERIAAFARENRGNPHVLQWRGRQMHFLYNQGLWSGGKDWFDSRNIASVQEYLRQQGVAVMFLPCTNYASDKVILDRTELKYQPWTPFAPVTPGELNFLKTTAWDGIGSWSADMPQQITRMVLERVRPYAERFLFLPAVYPGYDSSNRYFQAIHCPPRGALVLRNGLRSCLENGFRQINLKTWNDPNETMLLPSTRSPWGFSELIRYYRGLIEQGASPFAQPRFGVAYDSEVLWGDELYFQFFALPQTGAPETDYLAQIRLEDAAGGEVTTLTQRVNVPDEQHDALAEIRLDTTPWAGKHLVLSPVATVYRIDPSTGIREVALPARRLPPLRLRYNKLHYYTPYVVSLNRIAQETAVDLQLAGKPERTAGELAIFRTGDFVPLSCQVAGPTPLRRLMLAEDRQTDGAFREDDTAAAIGEGKVRVFLRLRSDAAPQNVVAPGTSGEGQSRAGASSPPVQATVVVGGGILDRRYTYTWFTEKMLLPIGQDRLTAPLLPFSPPMRDFGIVDAIGKPVFTLTAAPEATVTVRLSGYDGQEFSAKLSDLARKAAVFTVKKPADDPRSLSTLRLELAVDSCDPNLDMPLPASGTYLRHVPLDEAQTAVRVFHAWALTGDNRIAYSRPVCVLRQPRTSGAPGAEAVHADAQAPVRAEFLRTLGTFDDFVNNSSSVSNNYFTTDDIRAVLLPAHEIPYFLLNLDEGAGLQLNDSGNGPQLGRGWISGPHQWIPGWHGQALRLEGGRICLRSKTFPHGAYTFSLRLQMRGDAAGTPAKAQTPDAPAQTVISDGDHWLGFQTQAILMQVLPDGRVKARRSVRDCEGEVLSPQPLPAGWNHLAIVYDLRTLRLYVNGELAGEQGLKAPAYQRTHSTPLIGFDRTATPGSTPPAFTGALDQIELIGAALPAEEIRSLYERGQWMAR